MLARIIFLALAMAALLALSACASMTESECKVADWGRVGRDDGARGESDQRIAAYTEDCAKVGVRPNALAYRQGWDVGIQSFCTAGSGWREGSNGNTSKSDRCRGRAGEQAFSHYFHAGLEVHRTVERMRENDRESSRLESQLRKSTNDDEKRRLRERLRSIDRDQSSLRNVLSRQQAMAP
ncbi:MAG TPA: DUF2799 domain-containing protein [Burkholderiaceae bacterium]|nr:DUF2799 domain-containing protein [Burkholderiaceae bacterium]